MLRYSTILMVTGLLVGFVLSGYGYSVGQVEDTRAYSSVLCISCVGIDEPIPELSFEDKAELTKVHNPVEVMFFTAWWCPYCPAAHDYLEIIENATDGKVSVLEIDYDENPDLVSEYQIIGIPAVVVGDEVLVGPEIWDGLIPAILELSEGQS